MEGLLKIIIGLLVFILAVFSLTFVSWLNAFVNVIKGGIVILLFMVALGLILLGFSELKE